MKWSIIFIYKNEKALVWTVFYFTFCYFKLYTYTITVYV